MDDLAIRAKNGDVAARDELWTRSLELIKKYTQKLLAFRRMQGFKTFDPSEVESEVIARFPVLLERYKPKFANGGWEKYIKQSLYHLCLDVIRSQDPLGIKPNVRGPYPRYQHLGDAPHKIVQDGICAIDRGYHHAHS